MKFLDIYMIYISVRAYGWLSNDLIKKMSRLCRPAQKYLSEIDGGNQ